MRNLSVPVLLLGATLAAGCESGSGNVLEVDATGSVVGVAYLDLNGNGIADAGDRPFTSLEVRLVAPGSGATVTRAASDTNGVFRIRDVPVGRYRITVDGARLGDSVQLSPTAEITVVPSDSQTVAVPITFPKLSVSEARALPAGKRVFVEGLVVAAYGDTAHVTGGNRSIRATRLTSPSRISVAELPGDSVRILGVTGRFKGQPILDNAVLYQLNSLVSLPVADQVSSATAAAGVGGTQDASQVQVRNATILDTIGIDGQWFLRLDDGSGPVDFFLGNRLNFASNGLIPGAVVHATGVLVPSDQAGRWWLRWRGATVDLVYVGDASPFRPAAPSGAGAARLPNVVRVFWTDNSNNETGFRIERRTGNSTQWFEAGTAAAGAQEFTDFNVAPNATYVYRVRACNNKVCSAPSEEVGVGPA